MQARANLKMIGGSVIDEDSLDEFKLTEELGTNDEDIVHRDDDVEMEDETRQLSRDLSECADTECG